MSESVIDLQIMCYTFSVFFSPSNYKCLFLGFVRFTRPWGMSGYSNKESLCGDRGSSLGVGDIAVTKVSI
jgi:hypothetical protein